MMKHVLARTAVAVLVLMISVGVASADTPEFRSMVFAGVAPNGYNPGTYRIEESGNTYFNEPTPANTLLNYSHTYTGGPQGDIQFSANAAANYRGFWSAGTHAQGTVDNAYTAPGDTPQGFYVLGGMGSHTQHRFVSPESLTGPYSVFNWEVTGNSDTNVGTARSRLDFAVTQNAVMFDDFYNASLVPERLTEYGPGQYSYQTAIALDTPLDFLFWSSAYWEVLPDELAALGGPVDIYGSADFMSTFHLASIDLFNEDGTPVRNWSLLDEATGDAVFTQNGRVGDPVVVPEPGTAVLIAIGLLPLAGGVVRRRRA